MMRRAASIVGLSFFGAASALAARRECRHRFFVDGLSARAPPGPDGRRRDRFVIVTGDDSVARFALPTTGHELTADQRLGPAAQPGPLRDGPPPRAAGRSCHRAELAPTISPNSPRRSGNGRSPPMLLIWFVWDLLRRREQSRTGNAAVFVLASSAACRSARLSLSNLRLIWYEGSCRHHLRPAAGAGHRQFRPPRDPLLSVGYMMEQRMSSA